MGVETARFGKQKSRTVSCIMKVARQSLLSWSVLWVKWRCTSRPGIDLWVAPLGDLLVRWSLTLCVTPQHHAQPCCYCAMVWRTFRIRLALFTRLPRPCYLILRQLFRTGPCTVVYPRPYLKKSLACFFKAIARYSISDTRTPRSQLSSLLPIHPDSSRCGIGRAGTQVPQLRTRTS